MNQKLRNKWSKEEVVWFKENYPLLGANKTKGILNRSHHSILMKASKLKIRLYPSVRSDICKSIQRKPLSIIHKEKISIALINKPKSQEHIKNISLGSKGKIMSLEAREKISRSHKGKYLQEDNLNWKGGMQLTKAGYIHIRDISHPFANNGYVPEHRLIVEEFIGRYLHKEEVIHHMNEIKTDNRIDNLMIFPSNKEHMHWHNEIKRHGLTRIMQRKIDSRWDEELQSQLREEIK